MMKRRRPLLKAWHIIAAIISVLAVASACLWIYLQDKDVATLNPQGVVGMHERDLIVFTTMLSIVVVVPVFVMLGLFAWRYRESNTTASYTPDEDGNKWLETLWWGIPIVIIGILTVVTWVSTYQLDPSKPLNSNVKPLTVQVVALQWKWLFLYPDQKVASINELKIPAGTPVNFQITADAPMSAFWVPSLGTQVYAMSGMTMKLSLEASKPGIYRGSNSNINGKGYSAMNFAVTAMPSRRDFDMWAQAVGDNSSRDTLDWAKYEDIAKPKTESVPSYYHLDDVSLYNDVLNKYTKGDAMNMGNMKHDDQEQGK